MIYTDKVENNKLGNTTPFKSVADSLGWIISYTDDAVEKGFDGAYYEKGFVPLQPLEELQALKTQEIKKAFELEIEVTGTLVSSIDNFEIDARRVDVQNIQGLIDTYTEPTIFMGKNGPRQNTTLAELNTFKQELIKKGQALYYKKWQKEEEIKNATHATIDTITWED